MLCHLEYSVLTSFMHPCRRCFTISACSPHNLYLLHSNNPLIFFYALVSIIGSCNANINDVIWGSVLHFNLPGSSSLYGIFCLFVCFWFLLFVFLLFFLSSFFAKLCCLFLFDLHSEFSSVFHPSLYSV